jgi:hypothetical protein
MSNSLFAWEEFEAELLDPANHIEFEPVPRQRKHRSGWSPERQHLFLFALSRCGSVARAARSVGMTPRSAYRLAHAPGAEDFVRAWDQAIEEGLTRLRQDALQDVLGGLFVPVFRRGKVVRCELRHNNRLALALLSGKPRDAEQVYRRTMSSRREHWADIREFDATKSAIARQELDYWAAIEARDAKQMEIVERIERRMAERRAALAAEEGDSQRAAAELKEAAACEQREAAHRARVERLLEPPQTGSAEDAAPSRRGPRIVRL